RRHARRHREPGRKPDQRGWTSTTRRQVSRSSRVTSPDGGSATAGTSTPPPDGFRRVPWFARASLHTLTVRFPGPEPNVSAVVWISGDSRKSRSATAAARCSAVTQSALGTTYGWFDQSVGFG